MEVWWDNLKTLIKRDAILASKKRVRRLKLRTAYLRDKLNFLYTQTGTTSNRLAITFTVEELVHLRQEPGRGAQVRSGQHPSEILEPPSAYFYAVERKRAQSKTLTSMSIDGQTTENEARIRQHVLNFYTKLYSPDPINQDTADSFLEQLENRLPDQGADTLGEPITEDEVRQVILKLPQGKAPGLDGIPYDFYKSFREAFVPILARLFTHPPIS